MTADDDLRRAAEAVIDAYRFNSDDRTTAQAMDALRAALAARSDITQAATGGPDFTPKEWPEARSEMSDFASLHVPDESGGGFHRGPLPDESLTYPCADCGQDWPCDVVTLAKAARAVLDHDEKERWAGPHDWLADLIGYYGERE